MGQNKSCYNFVLFASKLRISLIVRDVSLLSEGGESHKFFPSCLGEGHKYFQGFLWKGHNVFKVFFIEKINYEYSAVAGAGFRFSLILPLPSKKKCPEGRNKTIYMNLDV